MSALAHERPREGKAPIPAWYGPKLHALTSQPPVAERVARWRTEMSAEDRRTCEAVAGPLLAALGYPVGDRATEDERTLDAGSAVAPDRP